MGKGGHVTSAVLLFSDELARFDYGDHHPFKPMRARNTLELCERYGLLGGEARLEVPGVATREALARFHEDGYLDVLAQVSAGGFELSALERGIGSDDCPPLLGVYDFSARVAGATLSAVDLVMSGSATRAFNLVGGLHHAYRDHAEGFCYVNDVGVAIEQLLDDGKRVAFVDIDAHHCNGVQDAYYRDDRVLVVSLHESGQTLYPWGGAETEIGLGKGRGYNVNVPLLEKTDDEVYVDTFRKVVPPLLEAFQPDIVLAEVGADTHVSDPLTHLRLTNNGYRIVVRDLCRLAPRLVALGGGGYDVFRTARCWTLAWAELSDQEPQDEYAGLVGGMMFGEEMGGLNDRPLLTTGDAKIRALDEAERVVDFIWEEVFPRVGAKRP